MLTEHVSASLSSAGPSSSRDLSSHHGPSIWAIEIKRTTDPKVSRGFHIAADDINADRKLLVYAGDRDVPGPDGSRAMPLATAIGQLRMAQDR